MKSPQTEDGFTKIANELLEAFSQIDASGSAWRVFMVVLRKTYGFHKKEDRISLTQFQEMSKLTRMSVCRGLNELVELKIITVEKEGYINKYSIQKDYGMWGSIKPVTSNKNDTKSSIKPVTKTSNKNDTYKRKKDNKDISKQSLQLNEKDMGWKQYNENAHADDELPSIGDDGEIEKKTEKVKRTYKPVYAIFEEVLGKQPNNWGVNVVQQKCAENLFVERGVVAIKNALIFYKEHKDDEYCPQITSPYDLDSKWTKLATFKQKHGNQ